MARDVETEHGIFTGEAVVFTPWGGFAKLEHNWRRRRSTAEQSVLAGLARTRGALQSVYDIIDAGEHALARTEGVHGAALNQAFKYSLVEETRFNPLAEIIE